MKRVRPPVASSDNRKMADSPSFFGAQCNSVPISLQSGSSEGLARRLQRRSVMERPLKITSRDFALSAAFETEIREKAAALETYYQRISGCEVTVEAPAIAHHRKGGPFVVCFRLTLPGMELVTDRQEQKDLSQAIREAFDAARRQLEDYARELRGAVKAHEPELHAKVSKLFPDYGFLETPDGREIYFHPHSVLERGFDQMEIGMEVRFVEEEGEQGPQASTVIILRKHPAKNR
jgi:cold shock CspA family protein/ribosome-associated translation inhibitor RaiA